MFNFSIIKTISKNTSSYPISLDDVKSKSEYFRLNPTDTTYDSYISLNIIPSVVNDWERDTGYLILDQTIQSLVPNLKTINTDQINIGMMHLNIREFTNFKYYPESWNYTDPKSTFDSSNYFIIPEAGNESAKLNFKQQFLPVILFSIINNLEANYKCGFQNNDFTDLSSSIREGLSFQCASIIDGKNGFCQDFYSYPTMQIYNEFSINKEQVTII